MKKLVSMESLGEALHVALRKGCDSAATSAAHICVSMMPDTLWAEYIAVVKEYLTKAKAAKRLTDENAWEHLLYVSTEQNSEAWNRAYNAFQDAFRAWRLSKLGEKPKAPTRYEPLEAKTYSPGDFYVKDRDNLTSLIKKLPEKETAGRAPEDIQYERDRWRYLFKSILETFSDDDWRGFTSYLYNE